ncbi:MAG: serine--tRNA ligase [archaeon]
MIDIKLLRENPQIVKDSQTKRGENPTAIDQILEHDKKWRELLQEADKLRQKRNVANEEIAKLKKVKKDATVKIKEMQELAKKLQKTEGETDSAKASRDMALSKIPNLVHDSVPPGKDDSDTQELKKWGAIPKFDFKPRDHIEICESLDLYDIERAAKTSGARFFFLKNEAALLETALANYAFNALVKKGFTAIIPPALVNDRVMYGVGMLPRSQKEIYRIEKEGLNLILTAEHAICGMHMDEVFDIKDLPLHYVAFSPCYRTEAGSHGRDTKGIFRVHQFNKLEMFSFSPPNKSWEEHELLLKCAENLMQELKLPYRIVNICTGELGITASKKYDIEAWLPGQGAYREVISCSNCTDYQARRLNIRYRTDSGEKPQPIHTLNSTALALSRTIIAILENNQQKDGSIKIPKILQPYMAGLKKIEPTGPKK